MAIGRFYRRESSLVYPLLPLAHTVGLGSEGSRGATERWDAEMDDCETQLVRWLFLSAKWHCGIVQVHLNSVA